MALPTRLMGTCVKRRPSPRPGGNSGAYIGDFKNDILCAPMLASTDYEITEAENGEQALAAIAKQRPDLILMDIQLPIVDGYTAVSRIVRSPTNRDRLSWIASPKRRCVTHAQSR
jgi:response regulator RpfG family c-di-GMP phosphodiesterase